MYVIFCQFLVAMVIFLPFCAGQEEILKNFVQNYKGGEKSTAVEPHYNEDLRTRKITLL